MKKFYQPFLLIVILVSSFFSFNCGKKGPLQPPLIQIPQKIDQVTSFQRGKVVGLEWEFDPVYTDGTDLKFPLTIEVWRAELGRQGDQSSSSEIEKENFNQLAEVVDRLVIEESATPLKGSWSWEITSPGSLAKKYVLALLVLDQKKKKSLFSPLITITPQNLPLPPSNVEAEVQPQGVILKWTPSSGFIFPGEGKPVKGYYVYRREEGGLWQRLTSNPVTEEVFLDKEVTFGQTYFYKIRGIVAESQPRLETADSSEIKVQPQDIFPPAPPPEVVAIETEVGISLSWEPSPEDDVSGYKVWRRREDELEFSLLTPQPIKNLSFTDLSVEEGFVYEYCLTAIDKQGNESKRSVKVKERKRR